MKPGEERDSDRDRHAVLAAMFGVYAAAELPDGAALGPASPLSPSQALEVLRRSRDPLCERARRVAGAKLAASAFIDGRDDLLKALEQLWGYDAVEAIAKAVGQINDPTADDVIQQAYAVLGARGAEGFAGGSRPQTQSHLDVRTLVTTAHVATEGEGSFKRLARFMDPRSWRTSPFWLAADKVIEVDGRFVRDPNPPPLGKSWKGYFYEYVSWAFNTSVVSAFQCFLDVDFQVDEEARRIEMRFSLYRAAGSMLLARVAQGGVNVDSGYSKADPLSGNAERGSYRIQTQKSIRYDDLLTRSTPNQGPPGVGQELNYMAPAVVALWMNDLTYESVRAWGFGEEPGAAHGGEPLR
jgi:hypothetical protein